MTYMYAIACGLVVMNNLTAMEAPAQKTQQPDKKDEQRYEIGGWHAALETATKWDGLRIGLFLNSCPEFHEQLKKSEKAADTWARGAIEAHIKSGAKSFVINQATLSDMWQQSVTNAFAYPRSCTGIPEWSCYLAKTFSPGYHLLALVPFFMHASSATKLSVWENFISKQETFKKVPDCLRSLAEQWFCQPEKFREKYGMLVLHEDKLKPTDKEKFSDFIHEAIWSFFFYNRDTVYKNYADTGCHVAYFGWTNGKACNDWHQITSDVVTGDTTLHDPRNGNIPEAVRLAQRDVLLESAVASKFSWSDVLRTQKPILQHFSCFYAGILLMMLMNSKTARVVENQVEVMFPRDPDTKVM